MRIGIDTHAAEQEGTGDCTYVRHLSRALLELDGENDYVFYGFDPLHPFYSGLPRRARVAVRRLWPPQAALRIPLALAAVSYRDRLDVLHVQYLGPVVHRGALVVTVHDLAFLRAPETFSRLTRGGLRWQVRSTVQRANAVITGSEYSRRDIGAAYGLGDDRLRVIPDAPAPHFVPSVQDGILQRRLGIQGRYLLCLGRLNPRKNLLGVLRAFECARPRLAEPMRLVIAGPRDYRSENLDAAIEASPCRDDVVRVGYVEDADLPILMSGATACVYVSFFEGFGLPPVEAMSCGTPVIASSATSLPEVLGDAALLVDPNRVDEIAAAIVRIASDVDLRAALAQKGLERASRFSWRTAALQTLETYRAAAARRAAPP